MSFHSLHFVVFFIAVFLLVGILRNRIRGRNLLLVCASYYFYGCWDWRFLFLLLISTIVDYACGLLLDTAQTSRSRRLILTVSLLTNLGILGFFKYYNFFIDSAMEGLRSLGFSPHAYTLAVILPVGISFYTFQTLGYTIDRYRGVLPPERSFLAFALYVSFFPQLVAGPIERAAQLLPQFGRPSIITWDRVYTGFYLICWGLFKKVVLADNVADVADAVFADAAPSGPAVAVGVYAFAIQIYCDFSGYTDIARGAARCMGFDLMVNFNHPYFAVSPSDFWRRWHISLSTWLRDYLYIPLGGNRHGSIRTYVNLMATMLLGGLWHGAAWTFVAWGAFHGFLLCSFRALQSRTGTPIEPASMTSFRPGHAVRMVLFFHLVCFGWLLFRAESLAQAGRMLTALVTDHSLLGTAVGLEGFVTLAACTGTLLAVQMLQLRKQDHMAVLSLPAPIRSAVYFLAMLAFVLFGKFDSSAFIYFQF